MQNNISKKIENAAAQVPRALHQVQASQSRAALQKRYALAHQASLQGQRQAVGRKAYAGLLLKEFVLAGALSGRVLGATTVTSLLDHTVGTTTFAGKQRPGFLGDPHSGIPKLGERAASLAGWHIGYAAATLMSLREARRGTPIGSEKGLLSQTKRSLVALVAADTAAQMAKPILLAPIYALQAAVVLLKAGIALVGATVGLLVGLPFILKALWTGPAPVPTEVSFTEKVMTAVFGPISFSPKNLDDFDPQFEGVEKSHAQNVTRHMLKRSGWQAGDKLGMLVDVAERWTFGEDKNVMAAKTRVIRRRALRMMGVKASSSLTDACLAGASGLLYGLNYGKEWLVNLVGAFSSPILAEAPQQETSHVQMPGTFEL